jgi:hypothetical protein
MPEQDFMPIQNFDYLEFYVGNAKQPAWKRWSVSRNCKGIFK